ncbi:hypothetical protein GCM10011374_36440 [Kocuria dechangensis]|uniref:Uncharacterized protein n=2 Tax=Kocuria dechangensis TaxID=1176249 RepID=A0A917H617_9MICC|nr:hypothetical protein GCM10011374_36440 [Kocuria dechangensis]
MTDVPHSVLLSRFAAAYERAQQSLRTSNADAAEVDRLAVEAQAAGIPVVRLAERAGVAPPRISIRISRHKKRTRSGDTTAVNAHPDAAPIE